MIHKVYKAQVNNPVKNDWSTTVQKDKTNLNLTLNDCQIKMIKKYKFKKIVKKKIEESAFKYLETIKLKHNKVKDIEYDGKLQIQNYLNDVNFDMEDKYLLFKLRTHMIEVKTNFKNQYLDT